MMGQVDLFCDASHKGKLYAGAYIIGGGEPVHVLHPGCDNSTDAEMLTMLAAIHDAIKTYQPRLIDVHTDVESIHTLMDKHQWTGLEPAASLAEMRAHGVTFIADGNSHKRHKVCHRHSRIAAGINGYNHPELRTRGSKQGSMITAMRRRTVLARLQKQSAPISEKELASRCLLPISAVVRALQWLKLKGAAACDVPKNRIDACDCSKRLWVAVSDVVAASPPAW